MAVVRILGIDPGTYVVGYGCLEIAVGESRPISGAAPMALRASNVVRATASGSREVRLLAAGEWTLGGRSTALPARLRELAERFRELVSRYLPDELAIEQAFHGKSVQAALRIGEARGVVLAEAAAARLGVHQFAPARVKRCVAGSGAAAKETVAAMVRQLLGNTSVLGSAPVSDVTDAVAVAWARLEERRSPLVALARASEAGTV